MMAYIETGSKIHPNVDLYKPPVQNVLPEGYAIDPDLVAHGRYTFVCIKQQHLLGDRKYE
ncbi:terminase large subunit [Salmonella phage 41]|nr:terminase large subunit [Salmonella phage 41]